MKKKIIKVILFVFIGLFIFTSGVVAAKLTARDVSFTSTNSEWNVNNVEDAVNDLYLLSQNVETMNLPYYIYPFDEISVSPSPNVITILKNSYNFDQVNIVKIYATRNPHSTSGVLHVALSDEPLTSLDEVKSHDNYYSFTLNGSTTRLESSFDIDTREIEGTKYINMYAETTGQYNYWYLFDLILDK